MKKTLRFLLVLMMAAALHPVRVLAQSVAINADSSLPDASAILDLKSFTKGFLAPRMTLTQRNLIAVPAVGLLIYQTDNTPGFYCYDGGAWSPVKGSGGGGGSDPFWIASGNNLSNTTTGNMGIGMPATANAKLAIQSSDTTLYGLAVYGPGGSLTGMYANRIAGGIGTFTNNELDIWCNGFAGIQIDPATRNVGISSGRTSETWTDAMLTVRTPDGQHGLMHTNGTVQLSTLIEGNKAYIGTSTTHPLILFANNLPSLTLATSGNIGLGALTPYNKVQIGEFGTGITPQINLPLVVNSTTGYFTVLPGTTTYLGAYRDIDLTPGANGNVGINSSLPIQNKLQIGNAGGFNGNDIAFGNGTQVTGVAQTDNFLQIGTTTDIVLLPRYGTNSGRVGINIATPAAALHVAGYVEQPVYRHYYYGYDDDDDEVSGPNLSILAEAAVQAEQFIVPSDERIKNIIGVSNTANDLRMVNAIRITDYTMKDRVEYGKQRFKKVIAQQVETVFPQVISRQTGYIPNVYQPADTIQRTAAGLLLHFPAEHHLTADAKKLRALTEAQNSMQEYPIVAIPSPTEVIIADTTSAAKRIFVYGQEVPDLRRVDYDGLTTLNLSATQELSKEVKALQRELAKAKASIRALAQLVHKQTPPKIVNRLTAVKTTAQRPLAKQIKKI